jgi:hypothetical protein
MIRWSLLVLAGALCAVWGCSGEVTIHLLSGIVANGGSSGDGGSLVAGAGSGGNPTVIDGGGGDMLPGGGTVAGGGTAGSSGALGDAGASAGDGGDMPPVCNTPLGAEVCNGGDDNCDGAIDEGCAFTLKWKEDPDGPALGKPGAMATDFSQTCPSGSLVVGLQVGMGTRLDQVGAICQQFKLDLDPTTQTPTSFSFTTAMPLMLPIAPAESKETDTTANMVCPAGMFITSLDGTTSTEAFQYTQRIQISCSPPLIADGMLSFDSTQTKTPKAITCTGCSAAAALNFHAPVAAEHVPTGLFGRDGVWVDLVGVTTSAARVTPH